MNGHAPSIELERSIETRARLVASNQNLTASCRLDGTIVQILHPSQRRAGIAMNNRSIERQLFLNVTEIQAFSVPSNHGNGVLLKQYWSCAPVLPAGSKSERSETSADTGEIDQGMGSGEEWHAVVPIELDRLGVSQLSSFGVGSTVPPKGRVHFVGPALHLATHHTAYADRTHIGAASNVE